jgi:hypothetical protein
MCQDGSLPQDILSYDTDVLGLMWAGDRCRGQEDGQGLVGCSVTAGSVLHLTGYT